MEDPHSLSSSTSPAPAFSVNNSYAWLAIADAPLSVDFSSDSFPGQNAHLIAPSPLVAADDLHRRAVMDKNRRASARMKSSSLTRMEELHYAPLRPHALLPAHARELQLLKFLAESYVNEDVSAFVLALVFAGLVLTVDTDRCYSRYDQIDVDFELYGDLL